MGLELQRNPDCTLRRGHNLLGIYGSEQVLLNAGTVWLIGLKQELRVRLESLGLEAETKRIWRVAADGRLVRSNNRLQDFQVCYRYEFVPLSYLYIVYVRGGSLFDTGAVPYSVGEVFGGESDLRDSEQLLPKLSIGLKSEDRLR
jgi:hypothetical protein